MPWMAFLEFTILELQNIVTVVNNYKLLKRFPSNISDRDLIA
jgi:hypothetical protein